MSLSVSLSFSTLFLPSLLSGKEKAHKHKQILPVTARVGGGLPTGWPGVSRPVARSQKLMCCVRNPRNINIFVRVPGWEDSGTRPGRSATGVTEKLFMCQMFMCLFWPLSCPSPPPSEHAALSSQSEVRTWTPCLDAVLEAILGTKHAPQQGCKEANK